MGGKRREVDLHVVHTAAAQQVSLEIIVLKNKQNRQTNQQFFGTVIVYPIDTSRLTAYLIEDYYERRVKVG